MNNGFYSLYSFDFFDTLASRSAGDYQRFYLQLHSHFRKIGYIAAEVDDLSFQKARMESERKARNISIEKQKHPEVSIYEIYSVLIEQYDFFLNKDSATCAKIEASFDEENLIPFAPLIMQINKLPVNISVAIVSDTFYPKEILTKFIRKIGINRDFSIFCSCDYKTGKYSNMFEHVKLYAKSKNINIERIIHIGDNYKSDVESPARFGISSKHLPFGDSLFWKSDELAGRYEELLCATENNIDYGVPLRVASAKALTQLNEYVFDTTTYYSYGARELAPIYAGFTFWVHKIALKNKENVLLFLMREGEFLATLYNSSRSIANDSISNNILFVSRKAVKLAAIYKITEESLNNYLKNINIQSFENCCDIFDINNHLQLILDCANIPEQKNTSNIKEEFIRIVTNNEILISSIENNALKVRRSFIRHFYSSLRLTNTNTELPLNVGLVDAGWSASIQKEIGRIFYYENIDIRINGYYLSTTSGADGYSCEINSRSHATYGYLFNLGQPSIYHDLFMRSPEIIEQSLTSPYKGSLIGYKIDGEPICSSKLLPEKQAQQITILQRAILDVVMVHSRQSPIFEQSADCKETKHWLQSRLLRVVCSPFDEEVELFKNWFHDENLVTNSLDPIINSHLRIWVNACGPRQLNMISMFDAYWLYALFDFNLNP